VTAAPTGLTLERHRDADRRKFIVVRRFLLGLLSLLLLAALLNVFGQHPETSTAGTARAQLAVYAPDHARSGLISYRRSARGNEREAGPLARLGGAVHRQRHGAAAGD
jgi:hypothetical protein